MKRYTLGIIAAGALAISLVAPNSAQARDRHVDISLSFGLPLYVQPAPVVVYYRSHYYRAQHHYYPPRGYYRAYPKWHNHHNHGKKHHWDDDSYDHD